MTPNLKYLLFVVLCTFSISNLFGVCSVSPSNLTYVSGSGASTIYTLDVVYTSDEVPNNGNTSISFSISGGTVTSGAGPYGCPCDPTGGVTQAATLTIVAQEGSTIMVTGTADAPGNSADCTSPPVSVILPVTITSFKAHKLKDNVLIQWSTSSEINNDFFNIERSSDSKNFEKLGSIAGSGNSNENVDYNFTDRNPTVGTNYYRLKQVDYNGAFEYSEIISIDFDSRDDHKFINDLTTDFIAVQNSIGVKSAQIFNTQGSKMGNFVNSNRDNLFTIPTNALAGGQYIVIYKLMDGQQKVEKFIKF